MTPACSDDTLPRHRRETNTFEVRGARAPDGDRQAMDTPATYVQLGFIVISIPNLLVIVGMATLFIGALVAPFPGHRDIQRDGDEDIA